MHVEIFNDYNVIYNCMKNTTVNHFFKYDNLVERLSFYTNFVFLLIIDKLKQFDF